MSTLSKDIIGAFLRRTSALIFKEIFSYLTGTVAQIHHSCQKHFIQSFSISLFFPKRCFLYCSKITKVLTISICMHQNYISVYKR